MELRHLRYFVAVAEELNYRRAAERLHIAAPPLSVQISKLEEEIETDLFARDGRGIKLTDAGAVFLEQARRILADADRSVGLAQRAARGELGELSIGHNLPAGFRVFPKIVPAYRRKWPHVHLNFHPLNIPSQLEKLRNGDLDVAFVWLPIPEDEFDVHVLLKSPLIAAVPDKHRLAKAKSISIRDLSGEPLIVPARAADPHTFVMMEQAFGKAGARMEVIYELENSISMITFVAMGVGCSLLPNYTRDIRQAGVVYKNIRAPDLEKSLAVVKRKGARDLAASFFQFTIETYQAGPRGAPKRSSPRG